MTERHTKLNAQIARIRGLGVALTRDVAPRVAKALEHELVEQIDAGKRPDGKPWPLTKDGKRALQDAARSLSVRAVGTVVLARLNGVVSRHHLGAVKGGVRRQILPTGKMPGPVASAISKVLDEAFRQHMRSS